jgi:hypothetical protein
MPAGRRLLHEVTLQMLEIGLSGLTCNFCDGYQTSVLPDIAELSSGARSRDPLAHPGYASSSKHARHPEGRARVRGVSKDRRKRASGRPSRLAALRRAP